MIYQFVYSVTSRDSHYIYIVGFKVLNNVAGNIKFHCVSSSHCSLNYTYFSVPSQAESCKMRTPFLELLYL